MITTIANGNYNMCAFSEGGAHNKTTGLIHLEITGLIVALVQQ